MPCDLEKSCACQRDQRISCSHWTPSRSNVYYNCDYYHQYKLECPKKDAGYPCVGCEYFDKGDQGRPNKSGIDWNNKDEVAQYKKDRR